MNQQQILFLAILLVSFGLFITERVRNDITAILIVLALYLAGILKPDAALSGFGSEPAIVVASIFVLAAGLRHTGLSQMAGDLIGRLAGSTVNRAIAVIMPSVAFLPAFTHHVTTTAVMLPVTLNLSREKNIPASKLLMPLSIAASLGTTITIIGAPAFLIASDALTRGGRAPLGIFSIAPIGIAISALGTVFMLLAGRFLLPSRSGEQDPSERFRLDEYFTEVVIRPESPFVGRTLQEVADKGKYQLNVVGWLRDGRSLRGPFGEGTVREGDILLVRTAPEELATMTQEQPGLGLQPVEKYSGRKDDGGGKVEDVTEHLVQVVVAPGSGIAGRTIGQVDFRRRFGALVVGIWRQRGLLDRELSQIHLRGGDVLVLYGDRDALNVIANDPSFLMMVPFQGEGRFPRRARLAALIMIGTIVLAATNLVALEMATLLGAVAMVLTRCLTIRQAYNSIDYRIYVFIAGAIPLGAAMRETHTSELVAGMLQGALAGLNQSAVLFLLFIVVGIVTQFMSDSATTAVFAPVGVSLAQALQQAPEAYVVTVAMASVAAFLTPIGHHGNLLVYGPGRYQFRDFLKVGTPLTILVGVVVSLLAPLLWPH